MPQVPNLSVVLYLRLIFESSKELGSASLPTFFITLNSNLKNHKPSFKTGNSYKHKMLSFKYRTLNIFWSQVWSNPRYKDFCFARSKQGGQNKEQLFKICSLLSQSWKHFFLNWPPPIVYLYNQWGVWYRFKKLSNTRNNLDFYLLKCVKP